MQRLQRHINKDKLRKIEQLSKPQAFQAGSVLCYFTYPKCKFQNSSAYHVKKKQVERTPGQPVVYD